MFATRLLCAALVPNISGVTILNEHLVDINITLRV